MCNVLIGLLGHFSVSDSMVCLPNFIKMTDHSYCVTLNGLRGSFQKTTVWSVCSYFNIWQTFLIIFSLWRTCKVNLVTLCSFIFYVDLWQVSDLQPFIYHPIILYHLKIFPMSIRLVCCPYPLQNLIWDKIGMLSLLFVKLGLGQCRYVVLFQYKTWSGTRYVCCPNPLQNLIWTR